MRGPEAALPRAGRKTRVTMTGFSTLDRRAGRRGGSLSLAVGIDPAALPLLDAGHGAHKTEGSALPGPITALCGVGDALVLLTSVSGMNLIYYIRPNSTKTMALGTEQFGAERVILPFHAYTDPLSPTQGTRRRMALIFPDKKWFDLDAVTPELSDLTPMEPDAFLPDLTAACVSVSRVFGVAGDRLYASSFNSASRWQLDTAGDVGAANAWTTTVQSHTYADDDLTAVVPFDGRVLCFSPHACHVVSGTKNPFRVSALFPVGAVGRTAICQAGDGLYFAARDELYHYNGETLTAIGAPLAVSDYTGTIACASDERCYFYVPEAHATFVYSPKTGAFATLAGLENVTVTAMTRSAQGCYAGDENGYLWRLDDESAVLPFSARTHLSLFGETDAKRLCRLHLTVTAATGATLTVTAHDAAGHATDLLSHTGAGGTAFLSSRVLTPADPAIALSFSGTGRVLIQDAALVFRTAGEAI